jgi:hypothetical protein
MKKNKMITKCVLLAILFLPISLSSQIKFAEQKSAKPENAEEPKWWRFKDIVYAPYDSSYLEIGRYPALDAYEKYIGQQLYLPSPTQLKGFKILYSDRMIVDKNEKKTYLWQPYEMRYEYYNNDTLIINKYYDIIGVLNIKSEKFIEHKSGYDRGKIGFSSDTYWYDKWKKDLERNKVFSNYDVESKHAATQFFPTMKISEDAVPYFILKEVVSGDTVYTAYPRDFILVGGFIKLQQKYAGKDLLELTSPPAKYNINNEDLITGKWKCVDVVLSKDKKTASGGYIYEYPSSDNRLSREKYMHIDLMLENTEDATKEKEIDLRGVENKNNGKTWITETEFRKIRDKLLLEIAEDEASIKAEEKEKQKRQEEENALEAQRKRKMQQESAAYKKQLTAKYGATAAAQIIAGKYVIGMTKAVCKEIKGQGAITVINKTATTETWQVRGVTERSGGIVLYFTGDKLVKIVNLR